MERQRDDDRHDRDRDGAHGEAAQRGVGHEEHAEHRQHERDPAEQHRAGGGLRNGEDRLARGRAVVAFFAQPRHDEQRVVDAQGQAHGDEHVYDEQVELEGLADHRDQAHRDDDRQDRHHQRDGRADQRPEHQDQHDQRRRQPELQLALLQVLLGDLVEVVADRVLAGDVHREPVRAVRALYRRDDVLHRRHLRLIGHHDGQQRGVPVAGDEDLAATGQIGADAAHLGLAAKPTGETTDRRRERRVVHREPLGAHDDELVERVRAGQPLVDQILRPHRLGLRCHAAVAGQRAPEQPARQRDPDERQQTPDGQHPLGMSGRGHRQAARPEPRSLRRRGQLRRLRRHRSAPPGRTWTPPPPRLETRRA
jgi:hypothetical protein